MFATPLYKSYNYSQKKPDSIIGSVLVSCGVVAVVVPKWLNTQDNDESMSEVNEGNDDHDDDDDHHGAGDQVDSNDIHKDNNNNIRCSECLARDAAQPRTELDTIKLVN